VSAGISRLTRGGLTFSRGPAYHDCGTSVNLVLFEAQETTAPLPKRDPRALHVLTVLGCRQGDTFDAGMIDGPRGKARILRIGETAIELDFSWEAAAPDLAPLTMIVGVPRPAMAKRVLRELTTLGVDSLLFAATEKGELSYTRSRLWTRGEYRRCLIEGAEQAFCTRLPDVALFASLAACLDGLNDRLGYSRGSPTLLALDNYEADVALSRALEEAEPGGSGPRGSEPRGPEPAVPAALPRSALRHVIAVGAERGWSAAERDLLRERGFLLTHLGERVLKTETACIVAATMALASLGHL